MLRNWHFLQGIFVSATFPPMCRAKLIPHAVRYPVREPLETGPIFCRYFHSSLSPFRFFSLVRYHVEIRLAVHKGVANRIETLVGPFRVLEDSLQPVTRLFWYMRTPCTYPCQTTRFPSPPATLTQSNVLPFVFTPETAAAHHQGAVPAGVELCGGGEMAKSIAKSMQRLVDGDGSSPVFDKNVGELLLRPL